MATLTGSTISSTYKTLLKTASSTGVTSTLSTVEDGDATASCLKLGTTSLNVDGKVGVNSSTSINANLHIKATETQSILVEDSSAYDIFYVGDSSSTFDCKIGDIDDASSGNDTYLHLKDSANSIILKGTYTGINQTSPSATLHVGNNDATVKFALAGSATAMTIGDASNADIVNIDTRADKVKIEGDLEVTGHFMGSSERYSLEEYFKQLPQLDATIDAVYTAEAARLASKDFELSGTNAADGNITFSTTRAGLQVLTAGGSADYAVIAPHTDTNQTAWTGVKWGTENQVVWDCAISTTSNITAMAFAAGLKLDVDDFRMVTDNDHAYFFYDQSDIIVGTITTNANLHFAYKNGTDNYTTNLGIVIAVNTTYRLKIVMDSDRKISVFVNGIQYGLTSTGGDAGVTESTSTTLSAAMDDNQDLIPFAGVHGNAKHIFLHYMKCSRLLYE